jgi:biphenyl 2,3-dioxygenase beta subunit
MDMPTSGNIGQDRQDLADLSHRARLQFEVEQFLYAEAAILDERRYEDWMTLLTSDIHYWVPIRRTTTAREVADEFTRPGDMAFFDDNFDTLTTRVAKTIRGTPWAEDPPSRTRHFVTNVRITQVEGDEIDVALNFCLYRSRLNSEEDRWVGRREDRVRRTEDGLKLARRHVFLDQTVILSQNMSNIF